MQIANIYQDLVFNDKKPVINVLFETSFTKEIRIAMQANTIMKEHKTSFPIVVEIVAGSIDFGVNGEIKTLNKGALIALAPNVPHDLKANDDSVIRLTLTKQDLAERVIDVSKK